ncbi:hypothetical protein BDV12DRAFT_42709 [Aspergillus spectabilis]
MAALEESTAFVQAQVNDENPVTRLLLQQLFFLRELRKGNVSTPDLNTAFSILQKYEDEIRAALPLKAEECKR